MDKQKVVYIYDGQLFSQKKERINVVICLHLEGIMLSGVSQVTKVKYYMIPLRISIFLRDLEKPNP
jgi:hypothetical protein